MAEIRFTRTLYLPEAVDAAVAAYAQLAGFQVDAQEHDIVVTVDDVNGYGQELTDRFCNHVLYESVVRQRGSDAGPV